MTLVNVSESDMKKFIATQALLIDLEHYLHHELISWESAIQSSPDGRPTQWQMAGTNVVKQVIAELNRLKKEYYQLG